MPILYTRLVSDHRQYLWSVVRHTESGGPRKYAINGVLRKLTTASALHGRPSARRIKLLRYRSLVRRSQTLPSRREKGLGTSARILGCALSAILNRVMCLQRMCARACGRSDL